MEKIHSYKDLIVWQKAVDFVIIIYSATSNFPNEEQYGLTSQLRRAAVSMPSNIAEGFRRGTEKEKLQFLRIAYGSGAEIETQLLIAARLSYITHAQYNQLTGQLDEILKILNTLIKKFRGHGRVNIASIIIALLLTTYCILPTASHATDIGLATQDSHFDETIIPGASQEGTTYVYNNSGDAPLPVHIQLSLWNLKDNSEDIEFVQSDPALDATRWFSVTPSDFILKPQGRQLITFKILAPADAAAGSYLVMMRFQPTVPPQYFSQEGPHFIPEIGVLFFINVHPLSLEGNSPAYGAAIDALKPDGASRLSLFDAIIPQANAAVFDEVVSKLVASIRNTGVYYFKSAGTIEIRNAFGQQVVLAALPERYLLPGRTRAIPLTILPPPPSGGGWEFFRRLAYDIVQQTYMGPYTATIRLQVPGQADVVSTVGFWIIPWKFWLSVFVVLAAIIFFTTKFRRRFGLAWQALVRGRDV